MTESTHRNQIIAGIFVLCGLILLCGLVLEFGPLRHRMRRPYTIYAEFSDAQSIIAGSPVRRAGAQIGKVASAPMLNPDMRGVRVALEIYPEYQIPKGSPLRVVSIGLMGDCAIDVGAFNAEKKAFVAEGDVISGESSADLTASAGRITDEAIVVMKDLRGGISELNKTLGRINNGLLSEENLKSIASSLVNLNGVLEKLNVGVLSEMNTGAFTDALAGFKKTMASATTAAEKANGALSKADSALAKMDKAMDNLGPGLKSFDTAADSLKDAAEALQELLKEARNGPGLLHALLSDPRVRDNFERLLSNLRRSGMLFYKDKEPSSLSPLPAPKTRRP